MDIANLSQSIQQIPPALLIFPGALYLFFGWQLYRVTLVVAGAVFGAFVGASAAHFASLAPSGQIMMVVGGGVVVGGLALFMKRMALFILGGLAGTALVMLAAAMFETEVAFLFWAIMMFLAGGSCAVKFTKPLVIFSTSLLGGTAVLRGVAMLVFRVPPQSDALRHVIQRPAGLALLLVLVAFGIFCQATSDGALGATPAPVQAPPTLAIPPLGAPPVETPPSAPSQSPAAPPPPADGQSR